MHPRDVGRLNDLLEALRDKGNTVVVVEHDPQVIERADHVVEVGPAAGSSGGEIVHTGTVAQLRRARTATGEGLRRAVGLKSEPRSATGSLPIVGASVHNLKNVSVDVPTGVLTAVTGVAGSGKSSLIGEAFLAAHPGALYFDQSPITASSRSTPATYLGLMDPIRKLFAKANKVDAGVFSFNSKGACEECGGRGVLVTEIAYMDPVTTVCPTCEGRRFKDSVLSHLLRGRSIVDVLEMTGTEAVEFFTEKPVREALSVLVDTGLGYLTLGQPLSSLSGGERQRIKLAERISGPGDLVVLDEPTTGLDPESRRDVWRVLLDLRTEGATILVTTHYLEEAEALADRLEIMHAGRIVRSGTPAEIAAGHPSTISFAERDDVPDDLAGVRHVRHERGRTTLETAALQRSLSDLLAWASHNDVDLVDLDARSPSLEAVFLAIADDRDASADVLEGAVR